MKKNKPENPNSFKRGAAFVIGMGSKVHKDKKKDQAKKACRRKFE